MLRGDFRLPLEEELRSQITPEQMCAYYSMLVAEARLHEAGYRGRTLFVIEEEEEETSTKIDDEVSGCGLSSRLLLNESHPVQPPYYRKLLLPSASFLSDSRCSDNYS